MKIAKICFITCLFFCTSRLSANDENNLKLLDIPPECLVNIISNLDSRSIAYISPVSCELRRCVQEAIRGYSGSATLNNGSIMLMSKIVSTGRLMDIKSMNDTHVALRSCEHVRKEFIQWIARDARQILLDSDLNQEQKQEARQRLRRRFLEFGLLSGLPTGQSPAQRIANIILFEKTWNILVHLAATEIADQLWGIIENQSSDALKQAIVRQDWYQINSRLRFQVESKLSSQLRSKLESRVKFQLLNPDGIVHRSGLVDEVSEQVRTCEEYWEGAKPFKYSVKTLEPTQVVQIIWAKLWPLLQPKVQANIETQLKGESESLIKLSLKEYFDEVLESDQNRGAVFAAAMDHVFLVYQLSSFVLMHAPQFKEIGDHLVRVLEDLFSRDEIETILQKLSLPISTEPQSIDYLRLISREISAIVPDCLTDL